MDKLQWQALEYEEQKPNSDWFWALGVIVTTSSLTAIIYGNYFFAGLLVLAGVLLAFFAIKKPDMVDHELNNKGLKIRTRLYPYENIESFWVQAEHPDDRHDESEGREKIKPLLFIKSERIFMPIITIPIPEESVVDIYTVMASMDVPEEEMAEHLSEKIMERLGF
jgi:hypothetical protein